LLQWTQCLSLPRVMIGWYACNPSRNEAAKSITYHTKLLSVTTEENRCGAFKLPTRNASACSNCKQSFASMNVHAQLRVRVLGWKFLLFLRGFIDATLVAETNAPCGWRGGMFVVFLFRGSRLNCARNTRAVPLLCCSACVGIDANAHPTV